jgi:hypothetical protein
MEQNPKQPTPEHSNLKFRLWAGSISALFTYLAYNAYAGSQVITSDIENPLIAQSEQLQIAKVGMIAMAAISAVCALAPSRKNN